MKRICQFFVGGLLLLAGACCDQQKSQNDRLAQELAAVKKQQATRNSVLEKLTTELADLTADLEKRAADLKAAQDRVKTLEQNLAATQGKRFATDDELIVAKLNFSTLKVCAMQGVMCMARSGELQKAEALAAFLVKSMPGDEDAVKLKTAIAAQRAAEAGEKK